MFWADLSRLGHRHVGVLFDIYQLLFFVVKIGRKNLDSALNAIETAIGRSTSWRVTRWCQKNAERLLALFVPVINLTLLGLASVLLVQLLPEAGITIPLWLPAAFVLGLAVALFTYLRREKLLRRAIGWPLLLLPSLLTTLVAALLLRRGHPSDLPIWTMHEPQAAVLAWLVAAFLVFVVMRA